jgi:hypothetical protein
MKKIFTLLVMMSVLVVNAQTIRILQDGNALNDCDTVFVPVDEHGDQVDAFFGYQNMSNNAIEFKVHKEVISMPLDGDMMFCIGDCYTGAYSQPQTLAAGQIVGSDDHQYAFHAIYSGSNEAALVKYTFFLTNDENDKVSFFIAYGESSSIKPTDMAKILNAYPNPASRMVNIEYAAPTANASLVIKNLTGREVYRTAVSQTGKKQIDLSQFNPGVYLYGVEVGGKMLCTKKLLVK